MTSDLTLAMQDGVECLTEDPPSAYGAISGGLHSEEALHDCHRVSARRFHVRPIQAGQLRQGRCAHPETWGRARVGLRPRHAVPALEKVSPPASIQLLAMKLRENIAANPLDRGA